MVRLSNEDLGEDSQLNLAPMIDVVFLLLIFFMVATTFATLEEQIDLDLPVAESGKAPLEIPDELIVDVDRDGNLFLEGAAVDEDALANLFERTARRDPDTPVTVRGDQASNLGRIVSVLDLCRVAGLSNAGLRTREG
ncbi:Biopolymer transport protein ExbD [Planctomycetes bacterium Pla163]|uniref:Biopolymer transport protein ExbD n=1 Tax=Rohdeia mirabilis TaxID=2528008 RepID=A0A518D3B2_9BACT|nr:Biopolymer transport protein ExbD [Planctomycetes bacterium Pla163]